MSPVRADCTNCQGRGCMGCCFREHPHDCANDCPVCCPEHGEAIRGAIEAEQARIAELEAIPGRLRNALAMLDNHTCHAGHTDADHLHLYKSVVAEIERALP